jgi:hypothetical protein
MNTLRATTLTLILTLASGLPAFAAAVDTSRTYSSGLLIGIFLAFCALLVVVQLVPSIMLLVGFIKGLTRHSAPKAAATARAAKS